MEEDLISYFMTRYLPREQIVYRLPVSESIASFWPLILNERRKNAVELPLLSYDGHPYWYVPTGSVLACGDRLAAQAREQAREAEPYTEEEGLAEEAYYSSAIEGAHSTPERALTLIRSSGRPKNKDERTVMNNYRALKFVAEHLEGPVNEAVILEIGRLLTENTLEEGVQPGYREGDICVVSGYEEVVYRAPEARFVAPMMTQLIAYINNPGIHPVIKACAAHIYFVTVHPFNDGNGRTARALAYMILLKAGYDYFRRVPVSGLLAGERSKYYKAIRMAQSPENGYDFTYFIEYYTDLLSRTAETVRLRDKAQNKLRELERSLAENSACERLMRGARWLVKEGIPTITSEKWRVKFSTSFETARQDLNTLEKLGLLKKRTVGRKSFYDVVNEE